MSQRSTRYIFFLLPPGQQSSIDNVPYNNYRSVMLGKTLLPPPFPSLPPPPPKQKSINYPEIVCAAPCPALAVCPVSNATATPSLKKKSIIFQFLVHLIWKCICSVLCIPRGLGPPAARDKCTRTRLLHLNLRGRIRVSEVRSYVGNALLTSGLYMFNG